MEAEEDLVLAARGLVWWWKEDKRDSATSSRRKGRGPERRWADSAATAAGVGRRRLRAWALAEDGASNSTVTTTIALLMAEAGGGERGERERYVRWGLLEHGTRHVGFSRSEPAGVRPGPGRGRRVSTLGATSGPGRARNECQNKGMLDSMFAAGPPAGRPSNVTTG
ncbi:uncharacterized protein A4U43_C04F23800 [Asparagus officinalis]|uniref:Uncharacterized protein n=1 Tax=Asparagus officinalis TaxID=4686 RepID=A0A5P1F8K3_ASPOF|nr:uncharacterized protein A4U43_C04F23800 [Asparagus officinalis]